MQESNGRAGSPRRTRCGWGAIPGAAAQANRTGAAAVCGILGTDIGSGTLRLEHSEVMRSGCNPTGGKMQCDDGKHPIYVATDLAAYPASVLRIVDSRIHDN